MCEECVQFRSLCGAALPEASRQVVNGAPDEGIILPFAIRSDGSAPKKEVARGRMTWE